MATPFGSPQSKRRMSHREHCYKPAGAADGKAVMLGTAGKESTTSAQKEGGEGRK